MPINHAALVRSLLCAAPGSVVVRSSTGERARGTRDVMDVDEAEESGHSRLSGRVSLMLPQGALPNTSEDDTVVVTEPDGSVTSYVVRDIRRVEDGLMRQFVVVPA